MRDLHASELGFVYGAGGGGKSCKPAKGKGGSSKGKSKKHSTRGKSHGSKGCR
jgi:hypothetical protein